MKIPAPDSVIATTQDELYKMLNESDKDIEDNRIITKKEISKKLRTL